MAYPEPVEGCKQLPSYLRRAVLVLLHFNVDSNYLAKLKQIIKSKKLEETVLWLPPQDGPPDMAALYRMADIVVSIPSSDGYGFTVYEAMATGCPTVISDLPVFDDELIDGVHTLKVPVKEAAQTNRALTHLLNNPQLCQTLSHNALRVCRQKSVNKRIEQTMALYESLIAEKAK